VDIALYGYNGRNKPGGNLTWHSYWQGKILLPGGECEIGLIEHPNHLGTTEEGYLLLRPWADRVKPFSLEDGLMTGVEFCTNLFARGQAYRLNCAYVAGDPPRFRLEATRLETQLGEAALTGKYIERLVLREHDAKVPFTVLLDRPEPTVRIPVGTYSKCWVVLKENDTRAFSDYRDWLRAKPVTITAAKAAILHAGGPLTNWVAVENQGRTLSIDYRLAGDGGRYRPAGPVDRANPPQVAIYRNGNQVGSGKLEYG
ncbi:MAG TPA: hypothetical protein VJA21_31685, partial [Verrucomicrobiae bacterium]